MKSLLIFCSMLFFFSTYGQLSLSSLDTSMVFIPTATFVMGSATGKPDAKSQHPVQLNGYFICKYEVTQALWKEIMSESPTILFNCADCPVHNATVAQIQKFIEQLCIQTQKKFRLPTEAEWEYAATGGPKNQGYLYSGSNNLKTVAWYAPNSNQHTHPIGQKQSNELGLYDMSGNVWELCSDYYHKAFYKKSPMINPVNTKPSTHYVVRGGSWRSEEQRCQARARNKNIRDHYGLGNFGFRLILEP